MKRLAYVLIFIAAAAIIILGGLYFRSRLMSKPAGVSEEKGGLPGRQILPPFPKNSAGGGAGLPTSTTASPNLGPNQTFGLAAEGPALDYFVDQQNILTVIETGGKILRISSEGSAALSSSPIPNLLSASFSNDGRMILITFGDPLSPQASVFDALQKTWQPIPLSIRSPSWSNSGHQISYFKDGEGAIMTVDVSKKNARPQEIFRFHEEDLDANWVASNRWILSQKSSAGFQGSLWLLDAKNRTVSALQEDQPGLSALWNKSGDQGLVFTSGLGERGGALSLINDRGQTLKHLSFATLPSKCVFYNKEGGRQTTSTKSSAASKNPFLACAIPRDAQKFSLSRLPDDYLMKALYATDDFYEINLSDGNVRNIFSDPAYQLDAQNLKVFNKKLFFTNRFDQKLYLISLSP